MIEKADKILLELESKFKSNLENSLSHQTGTIDRLFIKARAFAEIGVILKESGDIRGDQIETIKIIDEIFADVIVSIYFAGSGLDKPAQMLLRRVLELGIAIVFLWDLPHRLYSWKNFDEDLNFNEMLKHLTSEGYIAYIKEETHVEGLISSTIQLQKLYRELSNTVHGKISTFETELNNRFQFDKSHWSYHLNLVEGVLDELTEILLKRFSLKKDLIKKIPAFKKLCGGEA